MSQWSYVIAECQQCSQDQISDRLATIIRKALLYRISLAVYGRGPDAGPTGKKGKDAPVTKSRSRDGRAAPSTPMSPRSRGVDDEKLETVPLSVWQQRDAKLQ